MGLTACSGPLAPYRWLNRVQTLTLTCLVSAGPPPSGPADQSRGGASPRLASTAPLSSCRLGGLGQAVSPSHPPSANRQARVGREAGPVV